MIGLFWWYKTANTRCGLFDDGLRPKENLGDTILFMAITIILVLIAGLMSGELLERTSISSYIDFTLKFN